MAIVIRISEEADESPQYDGISDLFRLPIEPEISSLVPEVDPLPVYNAPFRIRVDTREQAPWRFTGLRATKSQGGGLIVVDILTDRHLDSGDYSVVGLERRCAIERKSKSDLFGSLGRERERFEREMQRLNEMEFAAVVIEADWYGIRELPPERTEMTPASVEGSILAWSVRFPRVHWFPCLDRRHAEYVCFRLLEFCHKEFMGKSKK